MGVSFTVKPTNIGTDAQRALDLLADKWCVLLVLAVAEGGSRFSDFAELPGLSKRVLAERLRLLVRRDILRTQRYQVRPSRDHYLLTERGVQLRRLLDASMHVAAGGRIDLRDAPAPDLHPADALLANDPATAERVYADTVAPLVRYDHRYRTSLVETLETWFACDMSISVVAGQLYTHRHTIRYRLDRMRELTGHDATTSDGGEQLALGLRARRVLAELGRLPD
jgi:DNA-binding HxlR family transcriptional regulator